MKLRLSVLAVLGVFALKWPFRFRSIGRLRSVNAGFHEIALFPQTSYAARP